MLTELFESFKSEETEVKCMAVTDEETKELCGADVYGRGAKNGYEFFYCRSHTPTDAIAAGGRMESLVFYIPETDSYITIN